MAASDTTKAKDTPSDLTILPKLLRHELDTLKSAVEAQMARIAALADDLAQTQIADNTDEIARLKERHAVELVLRTAYHTSLIGGSPVTGLPAFSEQIAHLSKTEFFDPAWYLETYPDVLDSGMSPKEHYIRAGAFEGRNPGPYFNSMDYYIANPDVAADGWPALVHYVCQGKADGRPVA